MPDFWLEPDEIDPERPERRRPARLVATGLAPTAEVPTTRRGKDTPPCYVPCEACGALVLTGRAPTGTRLALEPTVRTYTVYWAQGAPEPILYESQAYPVHRCHG